MIWRFQSILLTLKFVHFKKPVTRSSFKKRCHICNQFKSATLLSATHECTPKIWAKHERHSFQNWRVQIERHSFLGVSEVKECTLLKSLRIYRILTNLLKFFCATRKMISNWYFVNAYLRPVSFLQNWITWHSSIIFIVPYIFFNFLKSQCTYLNQNLIIQVRKFKVHKF